VGAYSVIRFGAIDEIEGDGAPYRPVRRHFGIASFGVSSFSGRRIGDRLINEHSEEDDQEELYLVLQGHRNSVQAASWGSGRSIAPKGCG
jgi:hypothetical protein